MYRRMVYSIGMTQIEQDLLELGLRVTEYYAQVAAYKRAYALTYTDARVQGGEGRV